MTGYINKEKRQRKALGDMIFLGAILVFAIIMVSIFPDRQKMVIARSWEIFAEMILILPTVMILMGLFTVWVPNEMVVKYLGKTAGIKGIFLAIIFGALPTGPLYVAFPMAGALIRKGARVSNIIVFLSAWACIKIPQEMVELQFLGAKFTAVRLVLTIIFVIVMGLFIERIIEPKQEEAGQVIGG
jgi:uncharacterized membrane protein YraQ (UPF0718 family)